MKPMPWTEHKPGYRAAPTASQSPAVADSESDCGVLGSAATRSDPPTHHENLTTPGNASELAVRSAMAVAMAMPALVMVPSEGSFIYFLRAANGLVKIGCTLELRKRVMALRCNSPIDLELIGFAVGGFRLEQALHAVLRETRSHGEWFHPSHRLFSAMSEMKAARWEHFFERLDRQPSWTSAGDARQLADFLRGEEDAREILARAVAAGLAIFLVERFEARVDRSGDCHLWTGGLQTRGYGWLGSLRIGSGLAHRFAWELERGPIPDGLTIDHRCRNKRCVRVEHLELVTREENSRRRWTWRIGADCALEVTP